MTAPLSTIAWYVLAAIAEIAGCFAFWAVLRLERSPIWLAAGVYIVASLVWLKVVEGVAPDRWDILGGLICLAGAGLILWGPGRG